MKASTIISLATFSAALYSLSKEPKVHEKLVELKNKGKDKINSFVKKSVKDDEGNELEFLDKLALKAKESGKELEAKIGKMVSDFYKKVNIAHTSKIKSIEAKLAKLSKELALEEVRLNKLEKRKA